MGNKFNPTDLNGSFPVDGDINPITRQPIDKVTANKWNTMSINELFAQRDILVYRISKAKDVGLLGALPHLYQAVAEIDARIDAMPQEPKIGIV